MKPYTIVHLDSTFKRFSMAQLKSLSAQGGKPWESLDAEIEPWLARFNRLPFVQTTFSCAGHAQDTRPQEWVAVNPATGEVVHEGVGETAGLNCGYVEWAFTAKAAALWKDRYLQNFEVRRLAVPALSVDVAYRLVEAGMLRGDYGLNDRAYMELWKARFHYEHREFAMGVLWNTLREMKKERGLKVAPKRS